MVTTIVKNLISEAITDPHIEDLPRIKNSQIMKLRRIGVDSVVELAEVKRILY